MNNPRKPWPSIVRFDEPLKNHCSLKIGGTASFFAEPSSEKEISNLLSFVKFYNTPYLVIGRGSNIFFDDQGFRGLIIKLGEKFSSIRTEANTIVVQSGAWMPYVARFMQVRGLSGLEHTVGIPGTIGGMVIMNGGSQGKYIGENIINVRAMHSNGKIEILTSSKCGFGYRKSNFQNNRMIVVGVTICCDVSNSRYIRRTMLKILRERRKKFPLKEYNCGSVFKSDPDIYEKHGSPGRIIEDIGFKGKSIGGVFISEKHANFFVNRRNGKARELLELIHNVEEAVYKLKRVRMVREVQFIPSP